MSKLFYCLSILCLVLIQRTSADTPANCSYNEIKGTWVFSESARTADRTENCDGSQKSVKNVKITLSYPDIATDEFGNIGHWVLVDNEGFDITVNYRKYFAFSYYEDNGKNAIVKCDQTMPAWSHDVLGNNWACFTGKKQNAQMPKVQRAPYEAPEGVFRQNPEAIKKINQIQNLWTARHYPHLEGKTLKDISLMKGGYKTRAVKPPSPAPVTDELRELASNLPENFDWRNVNGVNYVSPVGDQENCGSCFAFASLHMIEARLRIQTNNTVKVSLSAQDVVSCSEYSQGCGGGFEYLTAGKYAQDFGLVEEHCYPYTGRDSACKKTPNCRRYYTADFAYIGGYFGNCNEEAMRAALVSGGPITVGIQVYDDFMSYEGGIYKHTDVTHDRSNAQFDPWALTDHAVLAVGYGVENGQKYWIVKNSWGSGWGEKGYFRIVRGTNECNIESDSLEAFPSP